MFVRAVAIAEGELPRIAIGLAASGPVAWLDGDGASQLGRRSFVSLASAETRVLRGSEIGARELAHLFDGLEGVLDEGSELALSAPRATLALAYDLAWAMRSALGLRTPPRLSRSDGALLGFVTRHSAVLAVDHERREALVVADDEGALSHALERLDAARHASIPRATLSAIEAEPRDVHRTAIEGALEDIARGDFYQVNLARRFVAHLDGSPLALALAMREASPVPLGAYLEGPDGLVLVARTMERFLSFDPRTHRIETRPIKGTKPRATGTDAAVARTLIADEKERAEHAMIVDLMRNDLGRLAVPGSVIAKDVMRVEPYARLSHLVSIVEARANDDVSYGDILLATFPPGSVTGTPKLRAIERIEALERYPRGFYTGAVGSIARSGALSLAVAIRTATVERGLVTYFAGGGIVEASDPAREVDETELKAAVLEDARVLLASDRSIEGARPA
jgi:anthranilate synthase component 1